MKTVEAAVIGVGWVGGTRAETLSRTALVDKLHLCDIKPDRLAEVKALYKPATATLDYNDIIKNDEHLGGLHLDHAGDQPLSDRRDCLKAGKNVMLEKPIALELWEADELIMLAKRNNLKFTIGYSQRFNTKIAYAKKKIVDGTLGKVVSVLVSRHLSRALGKKIASRVRLSPVVMESTHDLDFVFWLLEPAKPVRVYSQGAYGYMKPVNGSHDVMFTTVTMDNGVVVMIGGGWNFPASYPNYCSTWIEITGTDGALLLDDTQRDNWLNTEKTGQEFPMSTMPGEQVDTSSPAAWGRRPSTSSKPASANTPVMVTPESARAGDGNLQRRRPVGRPQRAGRPAAHQRDDLRDRRVQGEEPGGRQSSDEEISQGRRPRHHRRRARRPVPRRGGDAPSGGRSGSGLPRRTRTAPAKSRPKIGADFVTQSHVELLKRPEVTARDHLHRRASARRADHGRGRARHSAADREAAGDRPGAIGARAQSDQGRQDRRRGRLHAALPPPLAGRPRRKCRTGALGDVTLVTSRAFMNRLVAIDNYKRTDDPSTISPMVISGTHALDICMWCLEGKTPVEMLRALDRQGAGPALPGHRRHRRHDHVRRRHASIISTCRGRCR